MFVHRDYVRRRLAAVEPRLAALVHAERKPVDELSLSAAVDRIDHAAAQQLDYQAVRAGEPLGPLFATYWLRCAAIVPETWAGARVDLMLDTRSEATLWLDGRAVQGLNSSGTQPRPDATLLHSAAGGERLAFEVEIACNDPFGAGEPDQDDERGSSGFVLHACGLARFDPDAWQLLWDFSVLRELESARAVDPSFAGELVAGLNEFCNVWAEDDRSTWPAARALLVALYERHAAGGPHQLSAVGHAHIDTAWLWPLEETWRKIQRTFATQRRLLEEYPEYVFAASQAQHYAWVKERDPALWDTIRDLVAGGRWAAIGAMWIEPDCNLPSGESLVRQLLHGQRFFERELGGRCTELWLPDSFGYCGQLPQLMRLAGVSRFLSQKLSWNRFNAPEHHTFTWQGIDGSEVLAHFPPADTYSAQATIAELRQSVSDYKDHERSRESLFVFGHGDGGGGPTRAMLERLRRARDLRGLPRTEARTPEAFFDRLQADADTLRTIVGELYFEYHRGTYTTQAEIKRGNRRAEVALHDAELLAAAAARLKDAQYPRAELAELWRVLLLNQFHDVLPGTSIHEVHERARADLGEVVSGADAIALEALASLGGTSGPPVPVNTLAFARREVVLAPGGELVLAEAPPCGAGVLAQPGPTDTASLVRTDDGGAVLENEHLLATLTAGGGLASLVHKATGREALAAGGNRLELYEDRPVSWDAWDIDPSHLETGAECAPAAAIAEVSADPLRVEVAFERPVGAASRLRQVFRLDAGANHLDVHTEADWHEAHRLLKVAFPLAVHAPEATFETAFGAVRRPTHYSNRHDLARYEVPGHRWTDLSEHGFGLALLTDCKYGYSAFGNTLRISLLRAPKAPDAESDMGRHEFAYAILPHAGGWQEGGVVQAAHAFNSPLRWSAGVQPGAWAQVDAPGLVLDSVKLAEDSAALVLRLYEAYGGSGRARISVGLPFATARRANLLEDDLGPVEVDGATIVIDYRPWEIVTLLVD